MTCCTTRPVAGSSGREAGGRLLFLVFRKLFFSYFMFMFMFTFYFISGGIFPAVFIITGVYISMPSSTSQAKKRHND